MVKEAMPDEGDVKAIPSENPSDVIAVEVDLTPGSVTEKELQRQLANAVLGNRWCKSATEHLTHAERLILRKVVGKEVETWRKEFGHELRYAASMLLGKLTNAIEEEKLRPGEMAYTLSVLADKAAQSEQRVPSGGQGVNVQVNVFGTEKADIIKALQGEQPVVAGMRSTKE